MAYYQNHREEDLTYVAMLRSVADGIENRTIVIEQATFNWNRSFYEPMNFDGIRLVDAVFAGLQIGMKMRFVAADVEEFAIPQD